MSIGAIDGLDTHTQTPTPHVSLHRKYTQQKTCLASSLVTCAQARLPLSTAVPVDSLAAAAAASLTQS